MESKYSGSKHTESKYIRNKYVRNKYAGNRFIDKSSMLVCDLSRPIKLIVICALILIAFCVTDFKISVLFKRGIRFFDILKQMFPPDISYGRNIFMPLINTIAMSVAGTFIGGAAGLILAPVCAGNINKNAVLRVVFKGIVNIIRTIPTIIIALGATFIFGIGTFAGMVAISIYTFAIITKLTYDDTSNTSPKAFDALQTFGINRYRAYLRTIIPSIMPGFINNVLYIFEANIRHAAILGYVGAGGIGLLINEKIAWRDYEKVGMICLMLFGAVAIIEAMSFLLKKIFIENQWSIGRNKTVRVITALCVGIVIIVSFNVIGSPLITNNGINVSFSMLNGILHPAKELFVDLSGNGIIYMLFETIAIAIAGTIIGMIIAVPLALLGSFRIIPRLPALIARGVLIAIRTIPIYIYGLMFIRVTGPGAFAGVMTIAMCSIGLLGKRYITAIDGMDLSAWYGYKAMGIGYAGRIRYTVLPQIMPQLISATKYRFDVNIREASVLGLVGAGGIGAPLIVAMNNYKWNEAGSIIISLTLIILLIELLPMFSKKE